MKQVYLLVLIGLAAEISSGFLLDHETRCRLCYECACKGKHHLACHKCGECGDQSSKCHEGQHQNNNFHQHSTQTHHNQHQTETQHIVPTTSNPVRTEVPLSHIKKCKKIDVFDAVARSEFVSNEHTPLCPNGAGRHGTNALVMSLCDAPDSSKWIEGEQILKDGVCSSSAEPYSPVYYHHRDKNGDHRLAAILLSCEPHLLKVFYQSCAMTPRIAHVDPKLLSRVHVLKWL